MLRRGLSAAKNACHLAVKTVVRYTTDGCTMAPDFNFRDCCVQHDYDYAEEHRTSEKNRARIDKKLRHCIKCKSHAVVAFVYWLIVRLVGWVPFWVFKRRPKLTVEEDQNGRKGL